MTEDIDNYEFLDWKRQVLGVEESEGANACSNSYIEKHTEIAESSYICLLYTSRLATRLSRTV